jgi:hypothetical protein
VPVAAPTAGGTDRRKAPTIAAKIRFLFIIAILNVRPSN